MTHATKLSNTPVRPNELNFSVTIDQIFKQFLALIATVPTSFLVIPKSFKISIRLSLINTPEWEPGRWRTLSVRCCK